MAKQVVWVFRKFIFLQFDSKFASKQQRLAKIGTIFVIADVDPDFTNLTH